MPNINHKRLKSLAWATGPDVTGRGWERQCRSGQRLTVATGSARAQTARAQPLSRETARRPDPHQQGTGQPAKRTGYTIAHAGRQVRFGPVAFWIAVGTIVIMAGWSITTATYFAFHDDVLKGLIARQAEQQFAYEDRIAELRAQIDRTTSRQLLDQEQFEQKLDELMRRQSTLESRATALGGVADPATTGSIKPTGRGVPDLTGRKAVADQRPCSRRSVATAASSPSIASKAWDASRPRSIASKAARPPRSARSRSATKARPAMLRGVFASLGLKSDAALAADRRPVRPGKATARKPKLRARPDPQRTWRAPMPSGSATRWSRCRCANR